MAVVEADVYIVVVVESAADNTNTLSNLDGVEFASVDYYYTVHPLLLPCVVHHYQRLHSFPGMISTPDCQCGYDIHHFWVIGAVVESGR